MRHLQIRDPADSKSRIELWCFPVKILTTCWKCCSELTAKGTDAPCPSCGEGQAVDIVRKGRSMTVTRKMTDFERKCAILDALIQNLKKEIATVRAEQAETARELHALSKRLAALPAVIARREALLKKQCWHVEPALARS